VRYGSVPDGVTRHQVMDRVARDAPG